MLLLLGSMCTGCRLLLGLLLLLLWRALVHLEADYAVTTFQSWVIGALWQIYRLLAEAILTTVLLILGAAAEKIQSKT